MKFKWLAEIEIDQIWVEDGYEITEERLRNMLYTDCGYAYPGELDCRILESPDPKKIAKIQGFNNDI